MVTEIVRVACVTVSTVGMAAVAASCGGGPEARSPHATQRGAAAHTPAPTAGPTINAPRDGSTTRGRFVTVSVTTPPAPKGAETWVTVTVNRRWTTDAVFKRKLGRTHRAQVPLWVGGNTVTATAEIWDEETAETIARSASSIALTRTPSRSTGRLDRATAYMATAYSRAVYWLCGEADGCGTHEVCFRVSSHRVDCPVGVVLYPSKIRECGLVMTVRLRGRQLSRGSYRCDGRLNPAPEHHVRRSVNRKGRRVHGGREAATERTRYGTPRFEYRRDLFIP